MLEMVKYDSPSGEITFTAQEVKERLCPNIEDKELALVMALCQAQKLNPFTKDVYIIKYGTSPASIVTSKEVFTKRAQANPNFEGYQAGLTFLTPDNQIIQREGSMPVAGWELLGGWCKVYVKGYRVPIYDEVSFKEYSTGKSNWSKMPGTMIRKVALCHALREAFPDDFQGLYGSEEMGKAGETVADIEYGTSEPVTVAQEYIEPEPTEEEIASLKAEVEQLAAQFAFMNGKDANEAIKATLETKTVQSFGEVSEFDQVTYDHLKAMKALLCGWIEKIIEEEGLND